MMTCSAPSMSPACSLRSCLDTLPTAKLLAATPAISAEMDPRELLLALPKGALVFVDYLPGTTTTARAKDEANAAVSAGMRHTHFIGRLIDAREVSHPGRLDLVFRLICLNRGAPGAGSVRTFSTRTGDLRGVLLLEMPRETNAPTSCVMAA